MVMAAVAEAGVSAPAATVAAGEREEEGGGGAGPFRISIGAELLPAPIGIGTMQWGSTWLDHKVRCAKRKQQQAAAG